MLSPYKIEERQRAEFLGCPVDLYSLSESVALIGDAIARRQRLQHVVVNVAKLVNMRHDPELRSAVSESDLINIDGMGVVWGCRLLGLPVRERVTGIDLMLNVLALCEERGHRPYFFGAKQEVLDKFVAEISQRYPALEIAGRRNGYFDAREEAAIAHEIRQSRADCLFVAISSPVKERFLAKHRDVMDVPFVMGVGGAFDVIAGLVTRAPVWMQKAGMEWLFRMLQEPRRLARRYVGSNAAYAVLLLRALLERAFTGSPKQEESPR